MTRRIVLAAAAVTAAAVVLAGCDSPSTAAYVGAKTVSTKQLSGAISVGLEDSDVHKAWGSKEPAYRRQVLDNAVYHALITQVASDEHVSVRTGEVDTILAAIRAGIQAQTSARLNTALARTFAVAPSQARSVIDDVALTGEVALKRGLLALPKQYRIGIIQVKNQATANAVAKQLDRDEASYSALAKRYPGANTLPSPATADQQNFAQSFGNARANAKAHSTFTLPVPDQSGDIGVVHVFSVLQPTAANLSAGDRATAVVNAYENGRKAVVKQFDGKIKINPRFGRWDTTSGKIADTRAPAVLDSTS